MDEEPAKLRETEKITFGPYDIKDEYTTETKITFVTADQLQRFMTQCPDSLRRYRTDLYFYIKRDDSSAKTSITYWRLDSDKMETFFFDTGYVNS